MTSDKITRYKIATTEDNKELLPEFICSDTVEGNGKYEYTYVEINNNLPWDDTLVINNEDEFLIKAYESVYFDVEKDGIITSIQSKNDVHEYTVRLGYRMVYSK